MPEGRVSVYCIDADRAAGEDLRARLHAYSDDFAVELFEDAGAAIAAQNTAPADIVIAELSLASMTGVDLVVAMRNVSEESICMLMSASVDLKSALDAVNRTRVLRFLAKPVEAAPLKEALDEARAELALRDRRRLAEMSIAALEQAQIAVAVIGADFRLVYVNDEAADIIRSSGAFALGPREELRGAGAEETAKLHEFFKAAAASARTGAGVLRLAREPGRLPVIVSALFSPGPAPGESLYNLVLTDPEKRGAPAPEMIAAALGISPSEARVVHGLVLGMDVGEAARNAGVSLSTARTYLRNSFSKTGVTRQAELVRLALLTAS